MSDRVQGVAVLIALVFVIWRLTQRRFSELDDAGDEIRWPELQPDGQTVLPSTLNPPGVRRTGGAGVEMDGDQESDYGEEGKSELVESSSYEKSSVAYGAVPNLPSAGGGAAVNRPSSYYDPYLAASNASSYPPSRHPSPGPNSVLSHNVGGAGQSYDGSHAYEYEQDRLESTGSPRLSVRNSTYDYYSNYAGSPPASPPQAGYPYQHHDSSPNHYGMH